MAKVLGLKQLLQKTYDWLEGLPEHFKRSFGDLVSNFVMIIWGESGNGKSNFMMQFLTMLMNYGKVLYVSLEEGHEATMQKLVIRQLDEGEHSGKIEFADHSMTYDELVIKLKKKKQARFIIIDSIQYWDITYEQYKSLKEQFSKKSFIFLSHTAGKIPDGKVANKIRYDAGIKAYVEGFVVFVKSRYGGNKPYVIWEEGARLHWGDDYENIVSGKPLGTKVKKVSKSKTTKSKKQSKADETRESDMQQSEQQAIV